MSYLSRATTTAETTVPEEKHGKQDHGTTPGIEITLLKTERAMTKMESTTPKTSATSGLETLSPQIEAKEPGIETKKPRTFAD